MNCPYGWWIEGEAHRFLAGLPRRKRCSLERAIGEIAAHPFRKVLFTDRTPDGLPLDVVESDGHLITHHVDHAVRRILVTEITPLS